MIEFGEKLKNLREAKGITQQTLADQLYVTRQAVSRWECGARYPDLLTAKRIAQALDTTIDELVSGEECRRDVEKEQVLRTAKTARLQIALYAIGMMPFFLMCLFSVKSLFPAETLRGTPAGTVTVWSFVPIIEYVCKWAVMTIGLIFAVRGNLRPVRVGVLMSIPFLAEAFGLGATNLREIARGNLTVGFFWPEVLWRIAAAGCVLCFFGGVCCKKRLGDRLLVLGILAASAVKLGILLLACRRMLQFATELGYVVRSVRLAGEAVIVVLLLFQTFVLYQKRREAYNGSGCT